MFRRAPVLLTLAAAFALTGCGDDDDAGSAGPPAGDARTIEVTGDAFAYDPDEINADVGEELAISLTSVDIVHDITIDEVDFQLTANRGDTQEGGLRVDEAGEYTFYCSIPGHRSAGMEGTLTVG